MGLKRMLEHLRGSCLGRGRAVKSTELEQTLRLSHAAVGQQVNRLRRKGEPVCSGPEGYGELRVEKISNTGEKLAGVHVQIKHIESGRTYSGFTEATGANVNTAIPLENTKNRKIYAGSFYQEERWASIYVLPGRRIETSVP